MQYESLVNKVGIDTLYTMLALQVPVAIILVCLYSSVFILTRLSQFPKKLCFHVCLSVHVSSHPDKEDLIYVLY